MNKLKGQIALITGGNSGIGLATAKLFREQGAQVIITARSPQTYEAAKKEYSSLFDVIHADVTSLQDLDNLYAQIKAKYGRIDVLFANAGVAYFAPTETVEEGFFDSQFDTNVKGLYFTVSKAYPLLKDGSRIILTASTVSTKGFAGASVYSATKAAVRSFARTWAAEWGNRNIRVNVLSPGPIETPIFSKTGMNENEVKDFHSQMASTIALKRLGASEEMANVALFLASNDSSYMTGSDIIADGGYSQL